MKKITQTGRHLAILLKGMTALAASTLLQAQAGVFTNNFNADPVGAVTLTGTVAGSSGLWRNTGGVDNSGYVSLTDAVGSAQGTMILPEIDPGQAIGGFRADFMIRIGDGTARPADGMAFVFSPGVDETTNFGEEGFGTGLVLSFDTWDNAGTDTAPAIDVKIGGTTDANIVSTTFLGGQRDANRARPGTIFKDPATGADVDLQTGTAWAPVTIQVKDGLLNLWYKGYQLVRDVVVNFEPVPGRFAFGARTGGANETHWIDNLRIETFQRVAPSVVSFRPSATGFSMSVQDLTGAAVDATSFQVTLDNAPASGNATKTGDVTTFTYSHPTLFASGSSHTVVATYRYGSPATTATNSVTFTVGNFILIPASYATPAGSVSTTLPGFRARVHQLPITRGPGDQNSIINGERQLADGFIDPATGQPYPNQADLTGAVNGFFNDPDIINWNDFNAGQLGNFTDASTPPYSDEQIPGTSAGANNVAAEILTFLELKKGVYRMGVSSDDGFKVTTGPNPRDWFSPVLGSFNGGRGTANSLFDIAVEQDGIYPFRLSWWEGGGDASLEWFIQDANGTAIPINDSTVATSVKAYRQGPAGPPFVKWLNPVPDQTGVATNSNVEITLSDAATQVNQSTIKLLINGQEVSPAISKPAGSSDTKILYDPAQNFGYQQKVDVTLIFGDSATTLRTNTYSFVTKPQTLLAIDDVTMWKYLNNGSDQGTAWKERNFDDSTWPEGPALLAIETGATLDVIRTPLVRSDPDNGQIVTDYFRNRFVFNGNPGVVRLVLNVICDDGAVFYLNGTEVARIGIAQGATFGFQTLFGDKENTTVVAPINISVASLVSGTNVLAAELHQSSTGSSDAVFGAELQVLIDTNAPATSIESILPTPNSSNVVNNAAIEITLIDGTRQVNTNTIQLTVNGQVVTPTIVKAAGAIATKVTYTPTTPYADESVVNARLTFNDTASPAATTTRDFSFTVAPKILVGINATHMWRYHNQGADLGTTWKDRNFDDSSWREGAAIFALETGAIMRGLPIRTPLVRVDPDTGNQIITDYFRTRFVFDGDPATARLRINYVVDDSCVTYLNGVELHRFLAAPDLVFDFQTTFPDHENTTAAGPFDIPATALVRGTNVLAVEVHQTSAGSSDVVFGLELFSLKPNVTLQFTRISKSGANAVIEWSGGGTLQSAPAVTGPWTNEANASSPLTVPAGTGMKFYRLTQ